MTAQYMKAIREPDEFIKFYMCDSDTSKWYILLSGITGDENEFVGGEYLLRIHLPENFPFSPPEFYFMTAQGLYGVETKVCVSIGEYHKDQYRATLGVAGFCTQLVSGLVGWREMGGGISILKSTAEKKRKLAEQSQSYNIEHHSEILALIDASFKDYSRKWDLSKIPEQIKIKLGLETAPL
jgi:ubiquitin-conjugating enzyme E2 J2